MRRYSIIISACMLCCNIVFAELKTPEPAWPEELIASRPVEKMLAYLKEAQGPGGHNLQHLSSWTLVDSRPLAFEVQADNRPHLYERCLYWVVAKKGGIQNWWLVVYYRLPYYPMKSHHQWEIEHDPIDGGKQKVPQGAPFHFASFSTKPSAKELGQFMKDVAWDFKPAAGFKFITAMRFDQYWQSAVGSVPKEDYKF